MANFLRLRVKDFCCIGKLDIRLNDRGLILITGNNQDSDAASSNGAGKSTLFKAIVWVLFGNTIDGDRHDEVIRWGQKTASVELDFMTDMGGWTIRRERSKGKPKLELLWGKLPFKGSKEEAQQKIIELIGLDFRGFCNTVLYGQNDINRFISATDSERKETLHRILRTDIFKQAERVARDKAIAIDGKMDGIKQEKLVIESKLAVLDENMATIKTNHQLWKGHQDDKRNALISEAKRYSTEAAKAGKRNKARLKHTREMCESSQRLVDEWKGKLKENAKELLEVGTEKRDAMTFLESASSERYRFRVKRDQAKEALSALEGEVCSVCNSPLDEGVALEHKKSLENELEQWTKKYNTINWKHSKLSKQVKELEERYNDIREAEGQMISALEYAEQELGVNNKRLADVKYKAKTEKDELKNKARLCLEQLKAMEDVNPYTEQLKVGKAKVKELEIEKKALTFDLKAEQDELAHIGFWVKGFGNQGLPSLLLDSTMPFLTERANHYLETLTDGDVIVEFSTQRELKSKKGQKRDELEVSWIIENVPDATPSGGQKRKLEIASDLALMDLVASREDSGIQLLLMDEILDGLDAEGVARVLQLLQEIRTYRSSVFVITHESGLSEAFEKVIETTKHNGVSTIEEMA